MNIYARVDSGLVVETLETDGDISEMFHPDFVWIDITGKSPAPDQGWTYDGSKFAKPKPVPVDPRPAILAELQKIDIDSARAMRTLILAEPDVGKGTPERDALQALELRAIELRDQLKALNK